eukprot:g5528.t1
MKFGERLKQYRRASWVYVDYEKLKLLIDEGVMNGRPRRLTFSEQLDKEIKSVNEFWIKILQVRFQTGISSLHEHSIKPTNLQLIEQEQDIQAFRQWVVLNYLAVLKIVKKYDKHVTEDEKISAQIKEHLFKQPFYQTIQKHIFTEASKLVRQCRESLFSKNNCGLEQVSNEKEQKIVEDIGTSLPPETLEQQKCPICLQSLMPSGDATLPCGHRFCVTCLFDAHTNDVNVCPMCRREQSLNPSCVEISMLLGAPPDKPDVIKHYYPSNIDPKAYKPASQKWVGDSLKHEKKQERERISGIVNGTAPSAPGLAACAPPGKATNRVTTARQFQYEQEVLFDLFDNSEALISCESGLDPVTIQAENSSIETYSPSLSSLGRSPVDDIDWKDYLLDNRDPNLSLTGINTFPSSPVSSPSTFPLPGNSSLPLLSHGQQQQNRVDGSVLRDTASTRYNSKKQSRSRPFGSIRCGGCNKFGLSEKCCEKNYYIIIRTTRVPKEVRSQVVKMCFETFEKADNHRREIARQYPRKAKSRKSSDHSKRSRSLSMSTNDQPDRKVRRSSVAKSSVIVASCASQTNGKFKGVIDCPSKFLPPPGECSNDSPSRSNSVVEQKQSDEQKQNASTAWVEKQMKRLTSREKVLGDMVKRLQQRVDILEKRAENAELGMAKAQSRAFAFEQALKIQSNKGSEQ